MLLVNFSEVPQFIQMKAIRDNKSMHTLPLWTLELNLIYELIYEWMSACMLVHT